MKINKIFKAKNNGFMLILTMLLISTISLLVVSVSTKVFVTRSLVTSIQRKIDSHLILANTISFLRNQFSTAKSKKAAEAKNQETEKDLKNENKDDNNDKLALFNLFWENAYKWKRYSFTYQKDGFDADVEVYLMCENGKIPLREFIKKIIAEKNKNKKKEEKEKNEENSEKDSKSNEENKKILDGSDYFKGINKIFSIIAKNSSSLKDLQKNIEINSKEKGQNFSDNINEKIFTAMINHYDFSKKDNINKTVLPNSIFEFFYDWTEGLKLYKTKNNEKIEDCLGDLFSLDNEKCNILYISPIFIKSLVKSSENEEFLSDEKRKKIIDLGENLINKKSDIKTLISEMLEKPLGIKFPIELFSGVPMDQFFEIDAYPKNISAIISIEKLEKNLDAFVVFERLESFSGNNKEYLIKQIYLI